MILIQERNRQILQMRTEGVPRREVALQFKLSTGRILQLEKRDAADKAMAERRGNLQEAIRSADDLGKMWLVNDVADAIGLVGDQKQVAGSFCGGGEGPDQFAGIDGYVLGWSNGQMGLQDTTIVEG